MFFRGKQQEEEIKYVTQQVDIWKCPNCIGWMQKEFTVAESPACVFCASPMVEGTREINVRM